MADIEKELGELRESQEKGKVSMEHSVSEASIYLQDQVRTFSPQGQGPFSELAEGVGDAKRYSICTAKYFLPFLGVVFSLSWECLPLHRECWSPQNVPSEDWVWTQTSSLSAHRRIRWAKSWAQGAMMGTPLC